MKTNIKSIIPALAAVAAGVALCTACGSEVKITKPSIDAQIIIDRSRTVETEAELRELERLANEYELAYRRHINGAAAERFKELTADVLADAANVMQRYQQQQQTDQELRAEIDDKLAFLDRAWRLELTTPEQDSRKLEQIAAEAAEAESQLAALAAERTRITEALDAVGYDDDDADELLERYGNQMDEVDRRYAEVTADLEEIMTRVSLYRLAYKLQRGEVFSPVTEPEPEPENNESETCDEDCM